MSGHLDGPEKWDNKGADGVLTEVTKAEATIFDSLLGDKLVVGRKRQGMTKQVGEHGVILVIGVICEI